MTSKKKNKRGANRPQSDATRGSSRSPENARGGTKRTSERSRHAEGEPGGRKAAPKKAAAIRSKAERGSAVSKHTSKTAASPPKRKRPQQSPSTERTPEAARRAAPERRPGLASPLNGHASSLSDQDSPKRRTKPRPEEGTPSSSSPEASGHDVGMLGIGSRVLPPEMDLELFDEEPAADTMPEDDQVSVEARIRELEARLDGMMRTAALDELSARPVPEAKAQAELANQTQDVDEATAVEAARELLESDYYRRTWGRASQRARAEHVDDFGLDPDFEQRLRPVLEFLFRKYFRVETSGIDNVPAEGRGVVVANHSGTLPFDGPMLRAALRLHHAASRDLRWLAEDFTFYLPFIGVTMNRIGAVRACQENAQRLLEEDHLIAVFPEGAKGIKKLFHQRYQLQRFGRGGYVRLCLRTRSPLIPCAIVGGEETNPMLFRFDNASKLLGLAYLPVTPTFPWLGPAGLLPAPTKWRITFGEPIDLSNYGPEAADDHVLVGRLSERVRSTISGMLEGALRKRRSIWL